MEFVSKLISVWSLVPVAAAYGIAIVGIVLFIYVRRKRRAKYFRRRDNLAWFSQVNWASIASGDIPASRWRGDPIQREVTETMLLDKIAVAEPAQLPSLVALLRSSGLLDARLRDARCSKRWKKKAALIALGHTRAKEAIAPLVEALESEDLDVRTAAVRGLGAIGAADAAIPMLERFANGELNVPLATASTALVSCCKLSPATLLRYLHLAENKNRELLARVLAETDLDSLGEELLSLASDCNPEIRACAARGLVKLDSALAVPALTALSVDDVWYVRLRAVIALGGIDEPASTDALLQALCDSNRLVRQRAAAALVRRSHDIGDVLRQAIDLKDSYGLQALVSEMERQGTSETTLRDARLRENVPLGKSIVTAREELRAAAAGAR